MLEVGSQTTLGKQQMNEVWADQGLEERRSLLYQKPNTKLANAAEAQIMANAII